MLNMNPDTKKPKLSLSLSLSPSFGITDSPGSIEDKLRTSFNLLNNKMFSYVNNPQLKELMSEIMESCVSSLGKSFTCIGRPIVLKSNNGIVTNDFFIGDDNYHAKITSVYVYACGEYVYKRSSFFINDTNCFFKLILEICLQNYANKLNCNLKVPAIYDYVLLQNNDYLSIEIKMERIKMLEDYGDIQSEILKSHSYLINKIQNGLKCFENNGLYHNDTHTDNIGFYRDSDTRGIQVAVMDFGKATLTNKNRYQSTSGFYEELHKKKEFEQWFSRAILPIFWGKKIYGGRKRRTSKAPRKKHKNTYRRK